MANEVINKDTDLELKKPSTTRAKKDFLFKHKDMEKDIYVQTRPDGKRGGGAGNIGGSGGGGPGGTSPTQSGVDGTGGLGGGGGGACDQDPRNYPEPRGGNGGGGVVIVRYKYQN